MLRHGIPVTSVARTLLDLAQASNEGRARRAFEEADRLGLLEEAKLEQACERARGRPAVRTIRRLKAEARTGATRSPLEDRFRVFCGKHRFPRPAVNARLLGYEVDAFWPAQRLVVELDGFEFHRHRAAFERDRARDTALQAAGYRVLRITDRRLKHDAAKVAGELRALLKQTSEPG
jgi:very-short-patch-repair endonuclease